LGYGFDPYQGGFRPNLKLPAECDKGNKGSKIDSKDVESSRFGDFADVICYNYGTPSHHKASCKKPNICFICKQDSHVVDSCPVKKQGHVCAKYIGSAANGLGFYNIEVPKQEEDISLDFTNCGKLYVEIGDITLEEL
jgi:hypothetical protein